MFTRVQNRNTGYSENLFSHPRMEKNTLSSIDGATALKLDESYELDHEQNSSINNMKNEDTSALNEVNTIQNNIPSGVSIESASYIENNNLEEYDNLPEKQSDNEEPTPKLFSEDLNYQIDENEIRLEEQ